MARNRTLKPGFFTNEDLCSLPFETRLLFAGLWTLADRSGRLEDRPKRIHAELFPYDVVLNVDAMLSALENGGFVYRYLIGESRYIQIACFFKHQTPHPHEIASKIQPIPFDLADSKACRDFSRQCRDMSYQAPSVCPSGSSSLQGLRVLQDLHPVSSGKPPEETYHDSAPKPPRKRSTGNPEQEVWFNEFRELFVWKWEGEDVAKRLFRQKVKTEETWALVRAAVVTQTAEQLTREDRYKTSPKTWLDGAYWKNRTSSKTIHRPTASKNEEAMSLFADMVREGRV